MAENIIEVNNLIKNFGKLTAVNDVSFNVARGEILGFLGPNGAGKTTTIRILCTLAKPSSGQATVNGYDVVRQQHQVRESIGLVFQDPSLDIKLSGIQNLRFHAMIYNVPSSVREQRIKEVLNMVELWDRRNSKVTTYSGGMKRRLELARGLLHHPKVLFLDEPTLGLDPQTRNRIWEYITDLQKQEGTTIFLTTHYMDEADKASRIAVIDNGKIAALDSPAKLKASVGKDIITLKTDDNVKAADEIKSRYQIDAKHDNDELIIEKAGGNEFLPLFIKEFSVNIQSISLRRPSLDDVFLKLTGHEIRQEQAGNSFKEMARRMGH
ncbi:MAG: ATP-binding cassette domain-containing protein [Chloroflexi bacterium]|jgi:ABC-2 type transport system ATP-binding protein|nr:ATP-binding cassette domain-containing protein [Chloroflexota bacterium]MBT7081087.1 ATP-binding cassette domain-containing protein [Chloroflexota bacterium]MBT7289476.1 ATP-binding cassette domain-containing protein [Chloroflexota bacterium]